MAEAIFVWLGVVDKCPVLALADSDVALDRPDVGMCGVDAAVHHGYLHALAGAALPGPVAGDPVDRVERHERSQTGFGECRREGGAQIYHEVPACSPAVMGRDRKNLTKLLRMPLQVSVARSPCCTISWTSRANSRAWR